MTRPHGFKRFKTIYRIAFLVVLAGTAKMVNANALAENCSVSNTRYAGVIMVGLSASQPNGNREKIDAAISRAKAWFATNRGGRNCRYLIQLPKGRFEVGLNSNIPTAEGVINLTGIRTFHDSNWVIIRGWGHDERNVNQTTLVTSVKNHTINSRNTHGVMLQHLHFTKNRIKVSQGTVIEVSPDTAQVPWVVIKLEAGFPTLNNFEDDPVEPGNSYGIYNNNSLDRKLRKYINVNATPRYVRFPDKPGGIVWTSPVKTGGYNERFDREWRVTLVGLPEGKNARDYFPKWTKVGLKSKHGGQAYRFVGGSRLMFSNVRWTHESRGVFRNVDRAYVLDSLAGYDPLIAKNHFQRVRYLDGSIGPRVNVKPYLATSSGGPQFGQDFDNVFNYRCYPRDPNCQPLPGTVANSGGRGHLVMRNNFIGLGDDSIAVFNVGYGVSIQQNTIVDGPARGILNYSVCGFFRHVGIARNNLINTRLINLLDTPTDGVNQGVPGTPQHAQWIQNRDRRCAVWKNDGLVEYP